MADPKPQVPQVDERLQALEEIMESPLGRAWLELDEDTDRPFYGPPKPYPMPGVVAPLPRRKRIGYTVSSRTHLPPMAKVVQFRASVLRTCSRFVVWVVAFIKFSSGNLWDRLRGQNTLERRAVRLRRT